MVIKEQICPYLLIFPIKLMLSWKSLWALSTLPRHVLIMLFCTFSHWFFAMAANIITPFPYFFLILPQALSTERGVVGSYPFSIISFIYFFTVIHYCLWSESLRSLLDVSIFLNGSHYIAPPPDTLYYFYTTLRFWHWTSCPCILFRDIGTLMAILCTSALWR